MVGPSKLLNIQSKKIYGILRGRFIGILSLTFKIWDLNMEMLKGLVIALGIFT